MAAMKKAAIFLIAAFLYQWYNQITGSVGVLGFIKRSWSG